MPDNLASKALEQASLHSEQVTLMPSAEVIEAFSSFRRAYVSRFPDHPFSSVDVVKWATAYNRIASRDDKILPEIFFNTYALGKLMKRNQKLLGIRCIGTYGNRSIYAVHEASEENNDD